MVYFSYIIPNNTEQYLLKIWKVTVTFFYTYNQANVIVCNLPVFPSISQTKCLHYRCCYITVDSATTALQNGACTYRCISKQMPYKIPFSNMKSLEINEYYITLICLEKFNFFNIMLTQYHAWHIPKVIEITINISNNQGTTPFCHVLCLGMQSNVMHRFMVHAFQDPPFSSSTRLPHPNK